MIKIIGVVWAIGGISALLIHAIYRLTTIGIELFTYPLSNWHFIILIITLICFSFLEGYLGFQRQFSPSVAARIRYLRDNPTTILVIFWKL